MQDFIELEKTASRDYTPKTVLLPRQGKARIKTPEAKTKLGDALKCDGILSQATCLCYFGRTPEHKGVVEERLTLMPINRRNMYADVTYYYLSSRRKLKEMRTEQIQHLLGVAEMRGMLGADPKSWSNQAGRQGARMRPDAVWSTPAGDVAIEFDTGSYRRAVVWDKVRRFEKDYPAGIVWGVSDPKRAKRMQESFPGVQMMHVDFCALPGALPDPYWNPSTTPPNPPDYRWVITPEQHEAIKRGVHIPMGEERGPAPGVYPYIPPLEQTEQKL